MTKNKLDKSDIKEKYFVYPETGVVTCVITGVKHDAFREFTNFTGLDFLWISCDAKNNKYTEMYNYLFEEAFVLKDSYVGVAKCNLADDVFNLTYGKDLAFERAYKAYVDDKKRMIIRISKFVENKIKNLNNMINTSSKYNRKVHYPDLNAILEREANEANEQNGSDSVDFTYTEDK